jgi:CheY-like chemotaxis protein
MPGGGVITILTEDVDLEEVVAGQHGDIPTGEYVRLSVSDTGTGIKRDVLKKMFDPFFTTKDKGKGTGVGLLSVRNIVDRHGAYVAVKTSEGKGTSFDIYFPGVDPYLGEEGDSIGDAVDLEDILDGCIIIVAEDEDVIRLDIRRHLSRKRKCNVVAAVSDGKKALTALEKNPDVDLVLTDISMPNMNGIELSMEILEQYPNTYICLLSGHAGEDDKIEYLLKDGRVKYVQKPIDMPDLDRTLGELMFKKKASEKS